MINIQNIDDNKIIKWFLIKCLHPGDHNPASNPAKDPEAEINFNVIKFQQIRDVDKIEEKRIVLALVFLVMKTRRNIQSMCQKYFQIIS